MEGEGIKIARLEFRDYLGIQCFEYDAADFNLFSGGNGRGKTTVLDGIQKTIFNKENPRPKLVRVDAPEAYLFVELTNGVTIERTINADDNSKDKVKVIDPQGVPVKAPESYLTKLLGQYRFGFNPVKFVLLDTKEKVKILLNLLVLEVNEEQVKSWFTDEKIYPEGFLPPVNVHKHALEVCEDLANDKGGWLYDKRKVINALVDALESETKAIKEDLPDNFNPDEWRDINLMSISNDIQAGIKVNGYRTEAQKLIDGEAEDLKNLENKANLDISTSEAAFDKSIQYEKDCIADLEKKIAAHNANITAFEGQKVSEATKITDAWMKDIDARQQRTVQAKEYLRTAPAVDIEPLNQKFQETEKMKGYISMGEKLATKEAELADKQYEAEMWDRFVKTAREKPKELLSQVKLPIENLVITGNNIMIGNLPIENKSTGEQLFEIALPIARATAGDFKFICVDKFETLDEDIREQFKKEIAGDGFQYFVTQVTKGEMEVSKT